MLLRVHSFLFNILCFGIVDTGEVRPAYMISSEVAGTHFAECYVIRVLRDVTYLTFVGTANQLSGCTYVEAGFNFQNCRKFLLFNFEHKTPQINQKLHKSAFTCEIKFYSVQNSEPFTEYQTFQIMCT